MNIAVKTIVRLLASMAASGFFSVVTAQVQASAAVQVEQAWVRPSVPGQQGTGGYMKLTAQRSLRLVRVCHRRWPASPRSMK